MESKENIGFHMPLKAWKINLGFNMKFINCDCLKGMKEFKDNEFDLAIVDPPYFKGPEKKAPGTDFGKEI